MGEKNVKCDSSDEILVRIEGSFAGSFPSVGEYDRSSGVRRGGRGGEFDGESEMEGKRESEYVESGTDISGRSWHSDDPLCVACQCALLEDCSEDVRFSPGQELEWKRSSRIKNERSGCRINEIVSTRSLVVFRIAQPALCSFPEKHRNIPFVHFPFLSFLSLPNDSSCVLCSNCCAPAIDPAREQTRANIRISQLASLRSLLPHIIPHTLMQSSPASLR